MRRCYSCHHVLDETLEVFRSTSCPSCGKHLKVCLNCRFYSPGAHWDCRETIDEPVRDKDKANFCGYFSYKKGPAAEESPATRTDARKSFQQLFGDGEKPGGS
jgi:predicted RNA-binding Zn-ribbon protein involved in translation (DUF1610 family)